MRDMIAPYVVGETIRGKPYIVDICDLPHLIIAGASNSGKSVALRSLIVSISYNCSVAEAVFFLFDTGANSLSSVFENLPHLAYPVIKDAMKGAQVFLFLEGLLNERLGYAEDGTRIFPKVFCVVDESISLIRGLTDKGLAKRVEKAIEAIFQQGRHAGMHLIWATQDTTYKSAQVDFGSVKSRMSFSYPQHQQSMAILGRPGAEKLTEKGSLLFLPPECKDLISLQGAYISPEDARDLVDEISTWPQNNTSKAYDVPEWQLPDLFEGIDLQSQNRAQARQKQRNDELCDIVLWSLGQKQVSRSEIMKTFHMSKRANEIFRTLDELGIIDDKQPAYQPRDVIPQCMGDLSDNAREFFINNEISEYKIRAAFGQSPEPNLDFSGNEGVSDSLAPTVRKNFHNGKTATDKPHSTLEGILANLH